MTATVQRVVAFVVLVIAGMLSLPLSAFVLDGSSATENLILPAQLVVMALIGAGLAWAFPALARSGSPIRTRLMVGAAWGLAAAVVGVAIFWVLINGLVGA